jgi:hypothetical protein
MSKSDQLGRHRIVAACPHVLQVMMAQVSGVSKTCGRAVETRRPSRIVRPAKPFFISETHGPQRVVRHEAAPEPTPVGRQDPEPWDTWQCRSPPWLGGEARRYRTCGRARAHPDTEVRFGAAGHVVAPEPTSAEGEVRSCRTHGSAWMLVLLLVLI